MRVYILVIALCLLVARAQYLAKKSKRARALKGLIIVPGIGRVDRLATLLSSLKLLDPYINYRSSHTVSSTGTDEISSSSTKNKYARKRIRAGGKRNWDCIVHAYAPSNDTFWHAIDMIDALESYCEIRERPKNRFTENLASVNPSYLQEHQYNKVFILLDDIKLMPSLRNNVGINYENSHENSLDGEGEVGTEYTKYWDLQRMLRLMDFNHLSVITPRIENANKGGGQDFRRIMSATTPQDTSHALAAVEGYSSVFVEIFCWIMTVPAYNALWDLLYPPINPYGWGYDFWYNGYASTKLQDELVPHKMGIVTTMTARHIQDKDNSALGRSESTSIKTIWQAVIAQEKFYKRHKGVDLEKMRLTMPLANRTWNGAASGFLYANPNQILIKNRDGGIGEEGNRPGSGHKRKRKRRERGGARFKEDSEAD